MPFQARDFDYDLPPEQIAQHPLPERAASRLLVMERATGALVDRTVRDLAERLNAGDLLVFNDTRVIPARLFGEKATGGKVEIFLERLLGGQRVQAQLRCSRPPATGSALSLPEGVQVQVKGRDGRFLGVGVSGIGGCVSVFGPMWRDAAAAVH